MKDQSDKLDILLQNYIKSDDGDTFVFNMNLLSKEGKSNRKYNNIFRITFLTVLFSISIALGVGGYFHISQNQKYSLLDLSWYSDVVFGGYGVSGGISDGSDNFGLLFDAKNMSLSELPVYIDLYPIGQAGALNKATEKN